LNLAFGVEVDESAFASQCLTALRSVEKASDPGMASLGRLAELRRHLDAAGRLPVPLDLERGRASFPTNELAGVIFGGARAVELRRRAMTLVGRDPALATASAVADMSREEERLASMRGSARIIELVRSVDPEFRAVLEWVLMMAYPTALGRLSVHTVLFEPAVRLLGSDEQVAALDVAMRDFGVLGCFALSEAAHASNAAGIETMAEFDIARQEFVITSPRPESGKFWIGGAGGSATHSVVYARLIVAGVDHGVCAFLVQLRRLRDGAFLPGVVCRDTGPKMGRNGVRDSAP
jgi:acyl-CoA oxidase